MRIGFTGTRKGMTDRQKASLRLLIVGIKNSSSHSPMLGGNLFIHGGCHGADTDADHIVFDSEYGPILVLPGDMTQYKNFSGKSKRKVLAPKPYLERNNDIIAGCYLLVAAPYNLVEQQRSGTWATIRYARKVDRPTIILDP
jgi:hypothetical protein